MRVSPSAPVMRVKAYSLPTDESKYDEMPVGTRSCTPVLTAASWTCSDAAHARAGMAKLMAAMKVSRIFLRCMSAISLVSPFRRFR
jgi:hypothetical protein